MEKTMSSEHSSDMIEAGAYSVDELREAVFEGRGRLARPLALALLAHKDYPKKVADLQQILGDESEQPRLRATAAASLGRINTPASVRALERGLQASDSVTLRAVAGALGSAGTQKHVKQLEAMAKTPGPVGRDAQQALGALRGRLGLAPAAPGAEGPRVSMRGRGEATPIRVRAAEARDVTDAIAAAPTRKLAKRSAVAFECQGNKLVFLFDDASLRRGAEMFDRRGEVGIVAEPPGVEGVRWSPRYSVSVEPEARGAFSVAVTTEDGRPAFVGRGTREGRGATFELAAADVPGALPIELRGSFDGQKVTISEARSGTRRQPSRAPSAEGDRLR